MSDFGETLRQERLARRITLEEISAQTKISVRLLQAIETEEFDRLPGGVFNVNFVRQYARHVGLDEEQVVGEFRRLVATPETPVAAPAVGAAEYHWDKSDRRRSWIAAAVVAGIAGIVFLVWVRQQLAPRPAAPRVVEFPAPAPAAAEKQLPPPPAEKQLPPPPAAKKPPVPAPAPPAPVSTLDAALRVELAANDVVWVSAKADGRQALETILQPQQSRVVTAASMVRLLVGDAAALRVTLNGQPLPPLGAKGHVLTLELTAAGMRVVARNPDPAAPQPKETKPDENVTTRICP